MGQFVTWDVLSPGPYVWGPHVPGTSRGTFFPWDLMSLERIVPCDVPELSGATFCPVGPYVWGPYHFMSLGRFVQWDILSSGTFCLGTFCLCTVFTSGTLRVVENRADSQLVARLRRDCPRQLACQAAVDPQELARGS